MIATISELCSDENCNTLLFASRAKEVQNKAEKNFDIKGDTEVMK